ncbi:putative AP2-endonuclease [Acaryochloris phage A-HIS2]|nr:putative AP2-endonuclease [Acaryochloris phage A-HIS2]
MSNAFYPVNPEGIDLANQGKPVYTQCVGKRLDTQGNWLPVFTDVQGSVVSPSMPEMTMDLPRVTIDTPRGVSWNARDEKYQARIAHNGLNVSLGYFDTCKEAKAAHDAAKRLSMKIKEHERGQREVNKWYDAVYGVDGAGI